VYVQAREGHALVETGDNLGAMTSELKPSEYMKEFVSGGPKNYTYKTVHATTGERKTVCKIRGITLNYSTSQLVNFEVIKDMVLNETKMRNVTVHTEKTIKRKRNAGEGIVYIITEPEDKMYRISFFKRRRLADNIRSRSGINRVSEGQRSAFTARPSMDNDLKFKHPFSCIVSGPSGSGKTSFFRRFLRNRRDLCTEPYFDGGVVWCYGEKSAVPSHLPAYIRINEGVPDDFGSANGEPSLVILDDLLTDVYSKQVCEMFRPGSNHSNISVILITQNLFHQGWFCRDISLNAHYIVAFKKVRDK